MNFSGFDLFWVLLLILSIAPLWKQHRISNLRIRLMRKIEGKRRSRVITIIHRQESLSFLGIPFRRHIDVEDSEQVLRAIRLTPEKTPIDLILHTPGGLVLAAEQIARALLKHPAKVSVFVPHYAMSGGTLIALAADEIIIDENAVMGPVDPQLGHFPAVSILKAVNQKPLQEVEDQTLILADIAAKALAQVKDTVAEILSSKMCPERARESAELLSQGYWTHDYPITYEKLVSLGLKVSTDLPGEVYALMEFYPQPGQRRPSVQYIPVPYEGNGKNK